MAEAAVDPAARREAGERAAMGARDPAALPAADEALVASLDSAAYDIPEVRRRLRALRDAPPRPKKAKPRRTRHGTTVANATMLAMAVATAAALLAAGPIRAAPPGVHVLGQSLFTTVLAPRAGAGLGGLNGRSVDWAVFFYKPFGAPASPLARARARVRRPRPARYCGACRRVRPFFRALGRETNATTYLRFGEIDCVRHRALCRRSGAKTSFFRRRRRRRDGSRRRARRSNVEIFEPRGARRSRGGTS